MRWTTIALLAAAQLQACGAPGTPEDSLPQGSSLPFRPLTSTSWSGYTAPAALRIDDAGQWRNAWDVIWKWTSPVPKVPDVDFATDMVLVFAMGQRPTCGYAIAVESVEISGGAVRAHLVETSPGPVCVVCAAVTSPVTAVAVPLLPVPLETATRTEAVVCH